MALALSFGQVSSIIYSMIAEFTVVKEHAKVYS